MNSFPNWQVPDKQKDSTYSSSVFFAGIDAFKEGESGIYLIRCSQTGRVYVGMAKNIRHRLRGHKEHLLKQKHHNYLLQRAFDKYGISCFSVEKLPPIKDKTIRQQEAHYINLYKATDPAYGYNLQKVTPNGNLLFTERQAEAVKNRKKTFNTYENYLHFESIYEFAKLNDHLTSGEIASFYGVGVSRVNWCVRGFNKYPKLTIGKGTKRLWAAYVPKMVAFFCSGDSCVDISKKIPFSYNRINSLLKQAGYNPSITPKKHLFLNTHTGVYQTQEEAAATTGYSESYFYKMFKLNKTSYV